MARNAPDSPARKPDRATPEYRRGATRTPRVRVASGFSPADRSRSPNRVRFSTKMIGKTSANASGVIGDMSWNARPSPAGSEDRRGMSFAPKFGTPDVDCDADPKNSWDRNRARPRATTLITTPDTMWSTRNVTVATACTSANSRPESALAMAAPRSSSGTGFALLCTDHLGLAPQLDPAGDLVGHHHGEDQEALEDHRDPS